MIADRALPQHPQAPAPSSPGTVSDGRAGSPKSVKLITRRRYIAALGAALDFLHFFFYLIVAAVCAGIASRIVPNLGKNGFLGSAVLGIIGAWVGTCWMGDIGPALEGVRLIPAIVGSAAVIFISHLLSRLFARIFKSSGKNKKPS